MIFNREYLKSERLRKNISCYELALRANIEKCMIYDLESGTSKRPSFCTVVKIAKALDAPLENFVNNSAL